MVLLPAEMHALDLSADQGQSFRRDGLGTVGGTVGIAAVVVDDCSQTRADAFQPSEDIWLLALVDECVEAQLVIVPHFLDRIEYKLPRLKPQPLVVLAERRHVVG